jgi:SAM-dependent methyltransferase
MTDNLYVQYGCGRVAPKGWLNYDASPSLKIQRTPLLGSVFKPLLPFQFDEQVRFGDIVKGLPLEPNLCDGIYASHVLEHLALDDFRQALKNTYTLLKPNGIFRCVLPDLEQSARKYVASLDAKDGKASAKFLGHDTALGLTSRPKNVFQFLKSSYGNAAHLWMWDQYSLQEELVQAGFKAIRKCTFNDCEDLRFKEVEEASRFEYAIAFEARK